MKYILSILFLFLFSTFDLFSQSITFTIKNKNNFPISGASIDVTFIASKETLSGTTNRNGTCQITNIYGSKPYIKFVIKCNTYKNYSELLVWDGNKNFELVLNDTKEYEELANKVQDKSKRVNDNLERAKNIKTIVSAPSESSKQSKVDTMTLNAIIEELELSKSEIEELEGDLSARNKKYIELQGDYDDLESKFKALQKQIDELSIIAIQFEQLEKNVSTELKKCSCIGWDDNYVTLEITLQDGRNGSYINHSTLIGISIEEEGKNSTPAKKILIDGEEVKEVRVNGITQQITLLVPKNEFKRRDNGVKQNYIVRFYNMALWNYRETNKIEIGRVKIIDMKEECGSRKSLKIDRA